MFLIKSMESNWMSRKLFQKMDLTKGVGDLARAEMTVGATKVRIYI